MNKQIILTGAGIILALLIAIGGWVVTGMLIESRSDELLSASGTARATAPW